MSVDPRPRINCDWSERPSVSANLLWRHVDKHYEDSDFSRAVECLRSLIESGDTLAKVHLGWLMLYGVGLARDEDQALLLYRAALDTGEVAAAISLAQYFSVREEWSRARAYYLTAAGMGSLVAAYRLGTRQELKQDDGESESMAWLEKAAIGGHVWSVVGLARQQWASHTFRGRAAAIAMVIRAIALMTHGVWQSKKGYWSFHPRLRK